MAALLSLQYVFITYWNLSMLGFPDGYLPESDLAASPIKKTCLAIEAVCSCFFGYLAVSRRRLPAEIPLSVIVVALSALMIVALERVIPWYFVEFLKLKDGRGG
jgi:hypothetical protein